MTPVRVWKHHLVAETDHLQLNDICHWRIPYNATIVGTVAVGEKPSDPYSPVPPPVYQGLHHASLCPQLCVSPLY